LGDKKTSLADFVQEGHRKGEAMVRQARWRSADGTTIIIHVSADDNVTDPAGNSGDRIACGVITRAAAKKM